LGKIVTSVGVFMSVLFFALPTGIFAGSTGLCLLFVWLDCLFLVAGIENFAERLRKKRRTQRSAAELRQLIEGLRAFFLFKKKLFFVRLQKRTRTRRTHHARRFSVCLLKMKRALAGKKRSNKFVALTVHTNSYPRKANDTALSFSVVLCCRIWIFGV
jgi:hypothetical protein